MSKRKKVHFADSLSTEEKDCKVDAPNKKRRSKPLNFDDGKTTEYKYFRELQEKINHDPQCFQVTKKDNCKKILKPSDNNKELCNSIKLNSDISLPLPVSITPISEKFLIASKDSHDELVYPIHPEHNKNKDLTTLSIMPIAEMSLFQTSQDSWNSAFKNGSEGLFSDKRCKLLALLSKSYSLETDKLILNRSDIISKIIKRLRIVEEPNRVSPLSLQVCNKLISLYTLSVYQSGLGELELEDLPELEIRVSDGIYHLTDLPQDVPIMQCNDSKSTNFATSATRSELCNYPFSNYFNEVDEHGRFELACPEVQVFPNAFEDDLLDKNKHYWKLDGEENSGQCARWISTSWTKWIPDDVEDGKHSPQQCDSWISTSLAKWIPDDAVDVKDSPEQCASWISTSLAKWIPEDVVDVKDSPEQCSNWISTTLVKWIPDETEDVTNKVHLTSCEELMPYYYSSCHSTDPSLLPYSNATCLDLSCLGKLEEHSMFSLPELNANNIEEQSHASNSLVCFGIDHVLPTLHAASNVRRQYSEHGWQNIFSSQLNKNIEMMLQDTSQQSLDISFPNLRRTFELQYKCLPINLDFGHLSATCVDHQLFKEKIENSEVFPDNGSKYDGHIDDVTQADYFSSPLFGSWVLDLDG